MGLLNSYIRNLEAFGALLVSGMAVNLGLRSRQDGTPRPKLVGEVPRVKSSEIARYLRVTGADPYMYRDSSGRTLVPATYFATWGVEQLAKSLLAARLPLSLVRLIHAASKVTIARLPHTGERCRFSATVETVEQTKRGVRVEQRLELVDAGGAPLSSNSIAMEIPDAWPPKHGLTAAPELASCEVDQVGKIILRSDEGMRYAVLSGDFEPSHWIGSFAKIRGLRGPIAHGYDLMARIAHTLVGTKAQGDPRRLRAIEATFHRPVVLPASLRLLGKTDDSTTSDLTRLQFWLAEEYGETASVSGSALIRA